MEAGALVVVHLAGPAEKYWGVLQRLDATGVILRGINLNSFEDWVRSVATEEPPSLGLATAFFPMHRLDRIFLDEAVGAVASLCQTFEQRVGMSVAVYLGLEAVEPGLTQ